MDVPRETLAQNMVALLREPGWSFEVVGSHTIRAYSLIPDVTYEELERLVLNAAALKRCEYMIVPSEGIDKMYVIKLFSRTAR